MMETPWLIWGRLCIQHNVRAEVRAILRTLSFAYLTDRPPRSNPLGGVSCSIGDIIRATSQQHVQCIPWTS